MTREEELIRIAKRLDKMVSRNNMEGAIDLLRELKDFNMTLKLLQGTRIGMSVNSIRKHCTDEEVNALAKVLIKEWKRLLDSGHSHSDRPSSEVKNNVKSSQTIDSPNGSPSDAQTRRLDVNLKHDSDLDGKHSDKNRKEKHTDTEQKTPNSNTEDPGDDVKRPGEPRNKKNTPEIKREQHLEEPKKQAMRLVEDLSFEREMDDNKQRRVRDLRMEKHKQGPRKERRSEEPKKTKHLEEVRKEKDPEEPRKHSHTDNTRKDKHRDEIRRERPTSAPQRDRPQSEKQTEDYRSIFERRSVLDGSILYPTRFPSPPRPSRPPPPTLIRRPLSVDLKKQDRIPTGCAWCMRQERKDAKGSKDAASRNPHPHARRLSVSPPPRRPSLEVRKVPPDPNAPIAPLPFHLHPPPPPPRKMPPDPNAPLPPFPLHLQPPPPPPKHPSLDGKKESRKDSSECKPPPQKKTSELVKKDRKDSSEQSKVSKNHSDEAKRERKDSTDSKPPPKKPSVDVKKEKPRKDSCDSKPVQPVKRHSTDSKPDRRESTDSKTCSSPPAKKLTAERRESHGSKSPHPGPPLRKPSTDSIERKGKAFSPKSPTTPTSPMSPGFSFPGGPLSPHLATGDSVRDKCIDMLAAALRTDNDFKDFGTNCESMAAEIEDHIYQETKATDMKYKNRVRSRISNLKDPKNPGLRKNILAGSIELGRFATMSAEEMASDELKQLRNVLTQEAIREHQMAKTGGTTTDLLQCGKCKKKNCTYNQVQTRSADEPMTTFCLCNECGNRWKFC